MFLFGHFLNPNVDDFLELPGCGVWEGGIQVLPNLLPYESLLKLPANSKR